MTGIVSGIKGAFKTAIGSVSKKKKRKSKK